MQEVARLAIDERIMRIIFTYETPLDGVVSFPMGPIRGDDERFGVLSNELPRTPALQCL